MAAGLQTLGTASRENLLKVRLTQHASATPRHHCNCNTGRTLQSGPATALACKPLGSARDLRTAAGPVGTVCLMLVSLLIGGRAQCAEKQAAAAAPEAVKTEDLEFRTWTDATGEYHTEAALIDFRDGKAQLKKRDGSVISVSLDTLSKADQAHVGREIARRVSQKRSRPADSQRKALRRRGRRSDSNRRATRASEPTDTGTDWPGWRGAGRDGKSPDTGLLKRWPAEGPKLLWKVDNIGSGFSSVAVSGGLVYITGDIGGRLILFAFDLDGKRKWRKDIDAAWTSSPPGARSTPMIDDGNLYLVSGNGLIGCYDASSGRGKWARQMREFGGGTPGWGYAESVLIYENLAIVTPGKQNCIVALDKRSGQGVWTSQGFNAGAQYSSCYAFEYQGRPMIVNGTGSGIVCVDPRNGRMLWSNPFSANNTANCPTPVFSEGYVFWANGYGKGGICLKLAVERGRVSAEEAWRTKDMVCHHGGYIVYEGHIYGNHRNGWVCLELKTGRKKWQERGVGKGSLCFADGMLYLFGEKGGKVGLATCSPDGMQMSGSFSVQGSGPSWAHPVVIGGRLYLRYESNLYCYDVRARGE